MKYMVGKISQMLDVSIETVRNYEKMGLVTPERNNLNDYRLYDAVDVNILRRARSYMGYHGIGMKQSANLLLSGTIDNLAEVLAQSGEELRKQIDKELELLFFTREKQKHLQRLSTMEGQFVIEYSPAMYGFIYRERDAFIPDSAVQRLFHDWNQIRPFTEASVHYDQRDFLSDGYRIMHGLLIEKSYADFFGIAQDELVQFYPSRKCLYTLIVTPIETEIVRESSFHSAIGEALAQRGLTLSGDPFGRVVHTSRASSCYQHFVELWVPVA